MKKNPHAPFGHWTFLAFMLSTVSAAGAQPAALDTLFAPLPRAFYEFGFAIAVDSDTEGISRLIVSEINHPVGPHPQFPIGVAYTYERNNATGAWAVESLLEPPEDTAVFGGSVAMEARVDSSFAVVGGGAFGTTVWRREEASGTWSREAVLLGVPKPGGGGAALGNSVAAAELMSGDEIGFIGAPNGGDDGGAVREGSAYAFVRPAGPNAWTMEARILAPDGEQGDGFGQSVALLPTPGLTGGHLGDALVMIGANGHPSSQGQDGAAYVYSRNGATGTWGFETKLVPADLQNFDFFGTAVALIQLPAGVPGEALALIGAFGDDDLITGSGAAYAFRREYVAAADTFRWVEETKLYPSTIRMGLRFGGGAVALTADTLESGTPVVLALVGANPDEFQDEQGHPGEANLFVRSTASGDPVWVRRATYQTGADGFEADWFGYAVAFAPSEDGPLVLVGAYRSNAALEQGHPSGTEAGAVFIYDSSVVVAADPGLPERPDALSLSVYPNPARGEAEIRLRLPGPEHVRVALYDVLGREVAVVFEGEISGQRDFALDTRGLAAGVYVVRADGAVSSLSQLLTVVR